MKKFLRRFLLTLAALGFFWLLVHLAENTRGTLAARAWAQQQQALGIPPSNAAWVLEVVPDQDNFAKAPIVLELLGSHAAPFKVRVAAPEDRKLQGNLREGRRADLTAWKKANGNLEVDALLAPMSSAITALEGASRRKGSQFFRTADLDAEAGPDDIDILGFRNVARPCPACVPPTEPP